MELNDVLSALHYDRSPNFLAGEELDTDPNYGHLYRKAKQYCGLHGVYALRGSVYERWQPDAPIVYVCWAESEQEALKIHKSVWNQNSVPFLLVVSRAWVRLYPGFRYDPRQERAAGQSGALTAIHHLEEIASRLHGFASQAIDTGNVWTRWGKHVTPEKRVDRQLLANLEDLDEWLRQDGVRDRHLSHSLIGKFVYLHYLRQRQILSDRKLAEWDILSEHVFSQDARLSQFVKLIEKVDEWLNGSVFPLPPSKIRDLGAERLRKVAAVFQGETIQGQLHLGFDAYDFSFIPIETLSVIYEQFLHATPETFGKSAGKARGAYYTPVPLVDFMLDRLDSQKPLQSGMRVLDPACGSGAFLVQCYRKLIERRRQQTTSERPRPKELRKLLVDHIFGVDTDEDACQIAELSLILTLLEYVTPPDLTNTNFKLPALGGQNILNANAFDEDALRGAFSRPFDWVVGNPPWKELGSRNLDAIDGSVLEWMKRNRVDRPVGGNQVAEAFAWRAGELASPSGAVALLLPAMTLFKYESEGFRRAFLRRQSLWSVANFANMAEVMFSGRARLPAAAFFYSPRSGESDQEAPEAIEVYSPLLANQPTSQPTGRRRPSVWNIVVNGTDLRDIPYRDVEGGAAVPWKLALWGTALDKRVLANVERRFKTFSGFEKEGLLLASQGLELRDSKDGDYKEAEHHPELARKSLLTVGHLKKQRYLFRLPGGALQELPKSRTFVRRGRFDSAFAVCQPPHVLVSASRTFAVYSEDFLIVPPRQIGIIAPTGRRDLLKALALYLNSDFVQYHQFLMTTEAGVQKTRGTLRALRSLPVPFADENSIQPWKALYSRIGREIGNDESFARRDLIEELNSLTCETLRLDDRARASVHDFVHVRLALSQGKIGKQAISQPSILDLSSYGEALRDALDDFLGDSANASHSVRILFGGGSGLITVEMSGDAPRRQPVRVWKVTDAEGQEFVRIREKLIEKRTQWLYFNRNLRIFEGSRVHVLKPLQRLQWTQSQAFQDAGDIIAETIQPRPEAVTRIAG